MKKPRVLITRKIPAIAKKMLTDEGYTVVGGTKTTRNTSTQLLKMVKGYDALLTLLTEKIDGKLLDAAGDQLQVVSNYAVGFDNIDLKAAKKRGIAVTNTPGVLTNSVSEHSVALMMTVLHRVVEADQFTRAGKYKGWEPNLLVGSNLRGKTVGIVGLGRIGQGVAHMVNKGFGAKVLYADKYKNKVFENKYGAKRVSLSTLLKQADIVSLHVPLLKTTRHLINAKALRTMKNTAVLINTSRGPVINEKALVKALKSGQISGAGLDVFEGEPKLAPGLKSLKNVVLTPHIASATDEARHEMAVIAAQNIIGVLEGHAPVSRVA